MTYNASGDVGIGPVPDPGHALFGQELNDHKKKVQVAAHWRTTPHKLPRRPSPVTELYLRKSLIAKKKREGKMAADLHFLPFSLQLEHLELCQEECNKKFTEQLAKPNVDAHMVEAMRTATYKHFAKHRAGLLLGVTGTREDPIYVSAFD